MPGPSVLHELSARALHSPSTRLMCGVASSPPGRPGPFQHIPSVRAPMQEPDDGGDPAHQHRLRRGE